MLPNGNSCARAKKHTTELNFARNGHMSVDGGKTGSERQAVKAALLTRVRHSTACTCVQNQLTLWLSAFGAETGNEAARSHRASRRHSCGVADRLARATAQNDTAHWRALARADAEEEAVYLDVLTKAFRNVGYLEGKNIVLDHRFPAEQPERFYTLARELVESKVDVIVAVTGLGAKAAKQATGTIPIVIIFDPDPVGNGLVESLARPGGNVTGLSLMAADMAGKRLSLFKEAVPKLTRVGVCSTERPVLSECRSSLRKSGESCRAFDTRFSR